LPFSKELISLISLTNASWLEFKTREKIKAFPYCLQAHTSPPRLCNLCTHIPPATSGVFDKKVGTLEQRQRCQFAKLFCWFIGVVLCKLHGVIIDELLDELGVVRQITLTRASGRRSCSRIRGIRRRGGRGGGRGRSSRGSCGGRRSAG